MSKSSSAAQLSQVSTESNDSVTSSSGVTFKRPSSNTDDGGISFIRMGQLKAGDLIVEGIYIGSTQNSMYPEKLDFKFKTNDDKTVVVNEGGNLKFRMNDIAAGTLVRIEYKGKQKITKGPRAGKEAHNVDVLVAE